MVRGVVRVETYMGPKQVIQLLIRLVGDAAISRADNVTVGVAAGHIVADRGWGREGEYGEEEERARDVGRHLRRRENWGRGGVL